MSGGGVAVGRGTRHCSCTDKRIDWLERDVLFWWVCIMGYITCLTVYGR